jgi:phosphate transport system substrate-binding protein
MHTFKFMVKRSFFAMLCWLALAVGNSTAVVYADTLRLGGSGSTTALAKLLVAAYNQKHPQDLITVTPALGTSGGIKALHAKAVGVALMSRPLTDSERDLKVLEFARTPFVLAVAASNPKSDMDFVELAKIYAASNPLWPDGKRMRLVLRPPEDNDSKIISRFSPEVAASWRSALAREGAFISATDEDTITAIQRLPGALGFTTLGQILADKRPLKFLSLQGKIPSVPNIKDGSYPHYKRHFMVTDSQTTPIIERFVAFAASVEAQTLLAAHGCWVGDFKTP